MNYLFENQNQGHYLTYTPFTCNKKLDQKLCDELTLKHSRSAHRTGSSLEMLGNILADNGYDIKMYHSTYKKKIDFQECNWWSPEQLEQYKNTIENLNLDWLPNDFKEWPIIAGISGNY